MLAQILLDTLARHLPSPLLKLFEAISIGEHIVKNCIREFKGVFRQAERLRHRLRVPLRCPRCARHQTTQIDARQSPALLHLLQ